MLGARRNKAAGAGAGAGAGGSGGGAGGSLFDRRAPIPSRAGSDPHTHHHMLHTVPLEAQDDCDYGQQQGSDKHTTGHAAVPGGTTSMGAAVARRRTLKKAASASSGYRSLPRDTATFSQSLLY